MEYRKAVFVITEEHDCPRYNVGDEIIIRDSAVSIDRYKQVCLMLVQEVLKILTGTRPLRPVFTQTGMQRTKFECGGCTGLIRFEYKKKNASYSTLQLNLLEAAKKRAKKQLIDHQENSSGITDTGSRSCRENIDSNVSSQNCAVSENPFPEQNIDLFTVLRKMDLLDSLDDSPLREISLMMKLKRYTADNVIIDEGERGTHFYVILSGEVAVVRKDSEIIAELRQGEVFGEMSLLSGGSTYASVYSKTAVQLATLNARDFKNILFNYPVLQVFFYRLLMHRVRKHTILADEVNSGRNYELADINSLELFRIINSSGKSGRVEFFFDDGKAVTLFNAGEIVFCKYNEQEGKEAFFTLLARQQGQITYNENLSKEEKTLPLLGGFMGLIMEGLVRSEP